MDDKFDDAEQPTIGATWQLWARDQKGEKIELQIWDTAGQETFKSLGPLYYRGAVAAVVVYDVTNRVTFTSVEQWINDFVSIAGTETVIYVIGNKIDKSDLRTVPDAEGKDWAEQRGYGFFETSAQTGSNVGPMFDALTADIVKKRAPLSQPRSTTALPDTSEEQGCG
jgi:small GTP-binding protein